MPKESPPQKSPSSSKEIQRHPAEVLYRDQLEAIRQNDADPPPASWKLSPRGVLLYVTGGETLDAEIDGERTRVEITRKFYGDDRLVERAIVTLASERALLLLGDPGTGKSWLSEHLTAAIVGDSTLVIQGTAGTTEEQIKYAWNIARVIAEGYSADNLVPAPTMVAMRRGSLLRFEEITRCLPDVQDALVSILSERNIAVPELPDAGTVWARPGFNVIATANSRDKGVNELSAALKRRFNYLHIPIVADPETEQEIIRQRSAELLERYRLETRVDPPILELLTTVFREMRAGKSSDGVALKSPSTTLSTAESISVALEAALHARFFGGGEVTAGDVARNLVGAVVTEDAADLKALREFVRLVARRRAGKSDLWQDFFQAASDSLGGLKTDRKKG